MSWWLNMFQAMAGLLLLWSLAFLLITGWGLLALRACRQSVNDLDGLLRAFWIGLWLVLLALMCWHFVFPVHLYALVLWAVGGLLGWGLAGPRPLVSAAAGLRSQRTIVFVFAIVAVLLSNCLLQQKPFFDTGLYYLQAIKWNQEHPLVAGLGNLHGRLAFNNSSFLLQALLLQDAWQGFAYGLVNGMLALVVTLQALLCFSRLSNSRSESVTCDTIGALSAVPIFIGLHGWFRLGPDTTAVAMQLAALYYAARFALAPAPAGEATPDVAGRPGRHGRSTDLMVAVTLLATAVTVKLSAAPFAFLLTLMLGGWSVYLAFGSRPALARSTVGWAVAVSAITVLPWCARGVVLSGYPLYPSSVVSVDVPWAVPARSAEHCETEIRDWARRSGGDTIEPGGPWIGQWFQRRSRVHRWMTLPLGLTLLVATWLVLHRREVRLGRSEKIFLALIALIAGIALAVWFRKAPSPRFGYQLFYILLIVTTTAAVQSGPQQETRGAGVPRRIGWMFAVFWFLVFLPIRPPASNVGYRKMPVAEMNQTLIQDGTKVFVPVQSLQAWAAELPSATQPDSIRFVRLRRQGDLSSGFEHVQPPVTADTGGPVRR